MRVFLLIIGWLGLSIATAFANVPAGNIGKIKGSGVLERGSDVIEGGSGVSVQTFITRERSLHSVPPTLRIGKYHR